MAGVIPEDFLTTHWPGDLFPGFCKQDPRWHIFDFQLLADLDYILLIDYAHYLENIERMKAYNQIEPITLRA